MGVFGAVFLPVSTRHTRAVTMQLIAQLAREKPPPQQLLLLAEDHTDVDVALDSPQHRVLLTWAAAGSEDTELGVNMEPEVCHGTTDVYARVQA